MNTSGQVTRTKTTQVNSGTNHESINVTDLPSGVYYVTIYSEKGNFTNVIMKQ